MAKNGDSTHGGDIKKNLPLGCPDFLQLISHLKDVDIVYTDRRMEVMKTKRDISFIVCFS